MALSTLINRVQYGANGINTLFAFPYKFLAETDLEVIVTDLAGNDSVQVLGSQYSIVGIPTGSYVGGGNVVFVSAPTSGFTVTIVRRVPRIQPSDYQNYPNYAAAADAFENDLDRRAMAEQELADYIDRTLQIPTADPLGLDMTLPTQTERAGAYLAFNTLGKPIASPGMANFPASAWARTLFDDSDAAEALSTLGISVFIKTLLDDSDAAAARDTLGVPAAIAAAVPPGVIWPYGGSSAPSGFLICDGSAVSETTYAALFAVIGHGFGGDPGGGNFYVPNFQGISPTGVGAQNINARTKTGPALGTVREDLEQEHRHRGGTWLRSGIYDEFGTLANSGVQFRGEYTSINGGYSHYTSPALEQSGYGTPRTGAYTHGPEIGVNWIIKT